MTRACLDRSAWLALALLALALEPRAARALEPQRFSLNWVREAGAESCSTSHRLTSLVQSAFGPVIETPDEADLAIEGRVGKHETTWRAHIAISDRSGNVLGRRELATTEPDCRALDAQILLVIAIAIDPEIALEGLSDDLLKQLASSSDPAEDLLTELKQQAPSPVPPATAPATAPPPVPTATDPPLGGGRVVTDRSGVVVSLQLTPLLSLSHQPSISVGLGLSAAVRPVPRWSLLAVAGWLAPEKVAIDDPRVRRSSVSFQLLLFSLSGCGAPLLDEALRWDVCAGAMLAARSAGANGLTGESSRVRVDPSPAVSSSVAYTFWKPFTVSFGASLDLSPRRTQYSYDVRLREEPVYKPAALGILLFFGVGAEV